MTVPYVQFLRAKEQIDERSRNRRIIDRFVSLVIARSKSREGEVTRIVEYGAGIGATASRLLPQLELPSCEYHFVDVLPEHVEVGRQRLRASLVDCGFHVTDRDDVIAYRAPFGSGTVHFITGDVNDRDFLREGERPDVVIGQALLDLLDVDRFLLDVTTRLKPKGLFYFPITYDGLTHFGPPFDPDIDARVERSYDRSIDRRAAAEGRSGGSRSGRAALARLRALEVSLLDAGSSDWVVIPHGSTYQPDEKAFLQQMLHFVSDALDSDEEIASEQGSLWLEKRNAELRSGELYLMARHIDILGMTGRRPS